MAEAAEENNGIDTVKLALSIAVLGAGIFGFHHFAEQAILYRVLGLVAFVVIAGGIALTTSKGRNLSAFLQAAKTEMRKMVWPTRVETVQTTMIVLVMVFVVAIFLWLLDMFLGWIMKMIIG